MTRRPHIMMLGLRGIHGTQGGIETHVGQLTKRLTNEFQITILTRKPYYQRANSDAQIKTVPLWCPRKASLETIIHSIIGVFYAAIKRPDILHIHAVGPSLVIPLARLFGLKVVATHHGKDYDREKWGKIARFLLKTGEGFMARFAQKRIVVSSDLQLEMQAKHNTDFDFIPNGVPATAVSDKTDCIDTMGLKKNKYILNVGRLVPEKRQDDLIKAFLAANIPDVRLVIAGSADHESAYVQKLRDMAAQSDNILLIGFVTGESLRQLFSHAGCFALPSSHEGLPIALLEAMQYGLPILASGIPGNLETGLGEECYFTLGDIGELSEKLGNVFNTQSGPKDWSAQLASYDWDLIAEKTACVYQDCLSDHFAKRPATISSNT